MGGISCRPGTAAGYHATQWRCCLYRNSILARPGNLDGAAERRERFRYRIRYPAAVWRTVRRDLKRLPVAAFWPALQPAGLGYISALDLKIQRSGGGKRIGSRRRIACRS